MSRSMPSTNVSNQPSSPPLKEVLDAYRQEQQAQKWQLPGGIRKDIVLELTPELKRRLVAERDNLAGLNLHYADLSGMEEDLRGANLQGADLSGANLTGTFLWDVNLRGADLTGAIGLIQNESGDAHPLSGADLTSARLPPEVNFPGLANIAEISKNAGLLFTSMVGATAFMLLIIAKTTDAQIILNNGSAMIPMINADIPVRVLFMVGPALLLVLYISFHFYMHRLWEMIADLPAIFPDGMTMTRKTFPWLFNELGRSHFLRLRQRPQLLAWIQDTLFKDLAYLLVPFSIIFFWARYLVRHDWAVTGWHVFLLAAFSAAFLLFGFAFRFTLTRNRSFQQAWRRSWSVHKAQATNKDMRDLQRKWVLSIGLFAAAIALAWIFGILSDYAISGYDPEVFQAITETGYTADLEKEWREATFEKRAPWTSGYYLFPSLLEWLHAKPTARLEETELSTRPDTWKGIYPDSNWQPTAIAGEIPTKKPDDLSRSAQIADDIATVRHPADLRNQNLRYANLRRAFLVNADLRGADLSYANLSGADLRGMKWDSKTTWTGANLSRVRLYEIKTNDPEEAPSLSGIKWPNAFLKGLDARGANLRNADFSGANLDNANFWGAHLEQCNLAGASFVTTRFQHASLTSAHLNNAKMKFAGLWGASLGGVDLTNAYLVGAFLSGADLHSARLNGAALSGAHLDKTDLRATNLEGASLDDPRSPEVAEWIKLRQEATRTEPLNLNVTDFTGASYDQNTVWPDGTHGKTSQFPTLYPETRYIESKDRLGDLIRKMISNSKKTK